MDILKDIEKSILSINMYDKTAELAKMGKIKKLVGEYFKHKEDEGNVVSQKMMKYDEQFKKVRERNDYEYELFLEEKDRLRSIFKETKSLSSLYDYLNYKYTNQHQSIPDIYTYEYFDFNERIVVPKEPKAAKAKEQKVPKEAKEQKAKEPKVPKEPKAAKAKELKDCPEGKVRNPITKRCVNDKTAPKAKEPKAKEPKELKECPEGKVRNPITKRCIKDVNYKKNE
jgi:hypothetical protein